MESLLPDLSALRTWLSWSVPLLFVLAAAASALPARAPGGHEASWSWARGGSLLAVAAAVLSLLALLHGGPGLTRGPTLLSLGDAGALQLSLRSDALGAAMLLLVTCIGSVIVAYSQPYLAGEPGQARYLRQLMLTLAAVTLLVSTNNLLVLAIAWVMTSLALHGLLTFYQDRRPALIAAHKKFIASRVADLCLLGGIALVGRQLGTLEIDQAVAAARALPELPGSLQAAALLIVLSASIKCAQLPVHGWLIQVMEAPTPVSALLHAGVVNLGGFLLLRLGTLVADVVAAQAMLVVVGSVTAVVAALVMTTRISVKVSLAWSTCAQMGFMLMQCGLGLHELALLHLIAHSLYKAHAFLGAGSAVEQHRLRQMTPVPEAPSAAAWALGALVGLGLVAGAAIVWGLQPAQTPALWAVGAILALALAPLLAGSLGRAGGPGLPTVLAVAFSVAIAYFGLHAAFGHWLGATSVGPAAAPTLVAWVLLCFAALFVVQGVVRMRPQGALARRMYPWLFAGLYLDELFTRLTFRLWPARLPARPEARQLAGSQIPTPGVQS